MKIEELKNNIKSAAIANKTLVMLYENSSDGIFPREVEPYSIKDGSFFGYDINKFGIRNFKLDKIISIKKTDRTFKPKWDFSFNN